MRDWSMPVSRRPILAIVTISLALMAAGAGITTVLNDSLESDSPPEGPDVSVSTSNPGVGSTTLAEDGSSGNVEDSGPDTPGVAFGLSGPDDVKHLTGEVEQVEASLSGTVSWFGQDIEHVTVVVSTWVPTDGWAEERRVSFDIDGDGERRMSDLFESTTLTLAEGERADAFDNRHDGTTNSVTGYVAVTVVVDDGAQRAYGQAIEPYTFNVTNIDFGSEDTLNAGGTDDVTLTATGVRLLNASNVMPGDDGANEITLTNTGTDNGVLAVNIETIDMAENGVTEPERAVDTAGVVELLDAAEFRLTITREDGTTQYLIGSSNEYVSVSGLETGTITSGIQMASRERLTVRLEWRVGSDAGNEIQSDQLALDFSFTLRPT